MATRDGCEERPAFQCQGQFHILNDRLLTADTVKKFAGNETCELGARVSTAEVDKHALGGSHYD